MTAPSVAEIVAVWGDCVGITHHADCWKSHAGCAIALIAAECDRLREQCRVLTDHQRRYTEAVWDALGEPVVSPPLSATQVDRIRELRAECDRLDAIAGDAS